jgi:acyl-coenzyme A synthetase/AMP-(fatty) acid ligase
VKEPAARSVEHWARTRAHEPALYDGEACLTYGDWNEYSDMLADAFSERGLGIDDVIAVRCRNRIEWAVIAVAAAKIDARLLTLDLDLPPRSLRERVIASGASAVIVGDADPAPIASAFDGILLRLRATMDIAAPGFFDFFDLFPPTAPPRFSRAQPAYVAWTRGETGRPRAVSLPRRASAPASLAPAAMPEAGCSLLTVPLHRAWGLVQFWAALAAGRSIALMRFQPEAALRTIELRKVTHWSGYPAALDQLSRLPRETIRSYDVSCMRDLTIGGAAVDQTLKARLIAIFGPIVSEAYGATETGVITVMPASTRTMKPGSCGQPLKGVMVQIRDRSGQPLPANATGEIWARTPRSLVCELPWSSVRRDPLGFVATADIGRMDEEGYLYITGRIAPGDPDTQRAG